MDKVTWRLIESEPTGCYTNMAFDEALFEEFFKTNKPVFRIYSWQPPALSLGRFQRADEILQLEYFEEAIENRIPLVRRMTGGGLIFHNNEITYSLVCSREHIPGIQNVKESYNILTTFILNFYKKLGFTPVYAVDSGFKKYPVGQKSPLCFAGWESFDILINNRKIGGNAQLRKKDVVFQHGSIPIDINFEAIKPLLKDIDFLMDDAVTSLNKENVFLDMDEVSKRLALEFSKSMDVELCKSTFTTGEKLLALNLENKKYKDNKWTLERKYK